MSELLRPGIPALYWRGVPVVKDPNGAGILKLMSDYIDGLGVDGEGRGPRVINLDEEAWLALEKALQPKPGQPTQE